MKNLIDFKTFALNMFNNNDDDKNTLSEKNTLVCLEWQKETLKELKKGRISHIYITGENSTEQEAYEFLISMIERYKIWLETKNVENRYVIGYYIAYLRENNAPQEEILKWKMIEKEKRKGHWTYEIYLI